MGYDLHITKAGHWIDSSANPISREAWDSLVEADSELVTSADSYYDRRTEGGDSERIYATLWAALSDEVAFWFQDGEVTAKNPDDSTILKMIDIAESLDARVLGDDGEVYHRKPSWTGWEASSD